MQSQSRLDTIRQTLQAHEERKAKAREAIADALASLDSLQQPFHTTPAGLVTVPVLAILAIL